MGSPGAKILAEVLKVAEAKIDAERLFPTEFHKVFHGFHVVRAEYDVAPAEDRSFCVISPNEATSGGEVPKSAGMIPVV